jgi:hypothetical protein
MKYHSEIWDNFCDRMKIFDSSVKLFKESERLVVETKEIGVKLRRHVLCRNEKMEKLIKKETDLLVDDWKHQKDEYDGLIYMMCIKQSGKIKPLYIGKTETIGKGDRNLSVNIENLHKNSSKFARWGDNYAYHIGDLSAVVIPGHDKKKINPKYVSWADQLFENFPSGNPKLKASVYFWTTAWEKTNVGIWEEFGATRLTFLEYLLIGVASSVFPELLLNREGQNRS